MTTLSIQIPEHLNERIEKLAARQKVSKSALVRETLLKAMGGGAHETAATIHSRLGRYQDAGGTGVSDLATNPKHLAAYGRH